MRVGWFVVVLLVGCQSGDGGRREADADADIDADADSDGDGDGDEDPAAPEDVTTGVTCPESLVVDGDHVYFTDSQAGVVGRVVRSGGDVEILREDVWRGSLAVSTDDVFYLNGGVHRLAKDGSSDDLLWTAAPGPYDVDAVRVALRGELLIWGTSISCVVDMPCGEVSAPVVLRQSLVEPAQLEEVVSWPGGDVFEIAVSDEAVFFTGNLWGVPGQLHRVPIDGGEVESLEVQGIYSPTAIVVGTEYLYVAAGPEIMRFPLAGGAAETVTTGLEHEEIATFAFDEGSLYWTVAGFSEGSVRAIQEGDDDVRTVVSVVSAVVLGGGLALDEEHVYWVECVRAPEGGVVEGEGRLRRVERF